MTLSYSLNMVVDNGVIPRSDRNESKRTQQRDAQRLPWDGRPFVAWDGEGVHMDATSLPTEFMGQWIKEYEAKNGQPPESREGPLVFEIPTPQPYILLANSRGERIVSDPTSGGLGTRQCLDFILDCKLRDPTAIFVGFGFTYDTAQILRNLPIERLEQLYNCNYTRYGNYRIEYYPRRWFQVTRYLGKKRISAKIFDVFGFFQTNFITACEKYLGKDDPGLALIREGKAARDTFKWEELNDFIIPYNNLELDMLVRMMNILRHDFHKVGLDLKQWYGPGAVANSLFKQHRIQDVMNKNIPSEVGSASQTAYAGGRFEQYYIGFYQNNVYEYDIRSAYAAAVAKLPQLSKGYWESVDKFESGSFGVWDIRFRAARRDNRPQPLFCRAKDGRVSFPYEVDGWYWTPEAELAPEFVRRGYVWRPANNNLAFPFVEDIYSQRAEYKRLGISSERALKAILTCIYGKLAQIIGGNDGPPTWHQLEWAGWITSYTRATIYKAILLAPDSIIAAETDALFSTEPLPLDVGEGLGQWELSVFNNIVYLQSGFYYATQGDKVICKYRGMDRDRETMQPVGLPYRGVLDHLHNHRVPGHWRTKALATSTTRFVNIGLALRTTATFRSWETRPKYIALDQQPGKSKRAHIDCTECQSGRNLSDCLHPLQITGYSGWSYPHPLPWLETEVDSTSPDYLDHLEQISIDWWQ